ncbi:MAG: DUF2341 domain-containing protein [Ignavibacteria bacterium]|nr:DUF2341 domain-containing protein [Ignavibacteria bacterium]
MKKIYLLVLLILLSAPELYSQFAYENPVWIKNNTGTALTDIQVLLKINTQELISNGWMQSDGRDIRFTTTCGGTSFIPYLIEGYLNTDSTAIWVKVPSIGANDSTLIYLYYGNSSATQMSTLLVFDGPHSSTDSVMITSTNTVSNCQRGFRFTANEDILVGYFGKRIPNATQRYLTLFDFNTQAILAQIQVDAGTAGTYNYNVLPTPLWLKSGQQYIMTLFNGASDMYYYGTSSQIGQHLTYGDMRYCNSCTQNTFPTSVLTNYHYGTPDFLYFTKQNVTPAPTFTILPPADTVTPAAPLNLTATPDDASAYLEWVQNAEFDVIVYKIYINTSNNPGTATLLDSVYYPDTTYNATGLTNGITYYFWVTATDNYCEPRTSEFSAVASCTPVFVKKLTSEIPSVFKLCQNYPNPFNPMTKIQFDIPKESYVEIKLYDITGREVAIMVRNSYRAGSYIIDFNSGYLPSGVYFYSMIAGDFKEVKQMVVLK